MCVLRQFKRLSSSRHTVAQTLLREEVRGASLVAVIYVVCIRIGSIGVLAFLAAGVSAGWPVYVYAPLAACGGFLLPFVASIFANDDLLLPPRRGCVQTFNVVILLSPPCLLISRHCAHARIHRCLRAVWLRSSRPNIYFCAPFFYFFAFRGGSLTRASLALRRRPTML